jgi:hypothetical protein
MIHAQLQLNLHLIELLEGSKKFGQEEEMV